MITYFGVLEEDASFDDVEEQLIHSGIEILDFYPALNIIKFQTDTLISEKEFDFFVTVEIEKEDFLPQ